MTAVTAGRDLVAIAIGGLKMRRLRSTLSALGIAIGIASMVAVLGISESSRSDLIATLDRLGTNLLRVTPGQSFFGQESRLPREAESMIERIAPVQEVSAVRSVAATVRRTDAIPELQTSGIRVAAVDLDLRATLSAKLADGRFLNEATDDLPVAVLGSVAAERLGIRNLSGRVRVLIGQTWFSVAGILEPTPLAPEIERSVLVGNRAASRYLGAPRKTSTIYVRAHPDQVEAVAGVLAPTANPERPEEVEVSRPSDALAARAAAKAAFTGLLLGVGAVALVVSAIGIANVMVISVLERRSEIGLRRSMGATRRHVRMQFLLEAVVLALCGGLAGMAIGISATAFYAGQRSWDLAIPPLALPAAAAVAVLIGAIAGAYPASRAARLNPAEALRTN